MELVGGLLVAIGGAILSGSSLRLLELRPPAALQAELNSAYPPADALPADMAALLEKIP